MKKLLALFALLGLTVCAACAASRSESPLFPNLQLTDLQVITASGRHQFKVWIADDEESRARGLMFVKSLPANHGMLFLFERPRFASFWMKDTVLALDIVFIDREGVVVNVAHDAEPFSLATIESDAPVKGALELVAGTAKKIGLTAGARILHPAFGTKTGSLNAHSASRAHD